LALTNRFQSPHARTGGSGGGIKSARRKNEEIELTGEELASAVESALTALAAGLGERGELRPGQLQMALSVAEAVRDGRPVVVQAGTGTGKTWAYLVGARLGGAERVVVATATKALQDQLAGKDLPAVAAAVEPRLTWAVVKGRSNYLCVQATREASGALELAFDDEEGGAERRGRLVEEVARLIEWAMKSQTGDRAELDFEPRPAAWTAVSVGPDECPGADACPSGTVCFAERAYERAREADVVVVNQHLLGAHVGSGGYVLPEADVVVVDEVHEAEDVLASALGVTLTPGRVRAVARLARSTSLARHRDALDRALSPHVGRRLPGGAAAEPGVAEALGGLAQALREQRDELRRAPAEARRDRAAKATDGLAADVAWILDAKPEETVTWVEQAGASGQAALRVSPLDVAGPLAKVVWSGATGVLTSATIPPGVAARLGLGADTVVEDVGSPFDYRSQALLYVPPLPPPRNPAHEAAAHDELEFLISAAGGRTLALFTSWRAMRAARSAVESRVPYRVLGQDDLPKPALIEAFRTEETSCLFATMGFWQGVDVPGASCSLVVIDHLPFARPDDPVAQARRERAGPAAFSAVDLPHAAVRLAQGAGRLIRAASDRGVVAVLDPRLAEAGYRRVILDTLPPMRRTRRREDVTAFFAGA
jgi:ATP-dependent DNA helicase DinG